MTATQDTTDTPPRLFGSAAPRRLVQTEMLVMAQGKAGLAVKLRSIALFQGPLGTGKSTAIRDFCAASGHKHALVTIADTNSAKAALQDLARGLLGHTVRGNIVDVRNAILDDLRRARGMTVIAVDEAQRLKAIGLRELRGVHDTAAAEGFPFALLLVGFGVDAALRTAPELVHRIGLRCTFTPISDARLLADLSALDQRIALTDPRIVRDLDSDVCQGNLRLWTRFLDFADALLGADTKAFTKADITYVLTCTENLGVGA